MYLREDLETKYQRYAIMVDKKTTSYHQSQLQLFADQFSGLVGKGVG